MSGTGKSSALAELGRRGYRVVDTGDPGWREYREYVESSDELHRGEWLWVVEEVRQLLAVLHPEGSQRLHALWKQLPGRSSRPNQIRSALEQLRDLLLRLSRDWRSYCTFQSEPEVPWTNNATERAIGRMKMRARTVRGYKSWQGMESGLLLAGTLAR